MVIKTFYLSILALVLLYLSKTFDSINHQRLLRKLSNVEASKETIHCFSSYLADRVQSIRIDSTLSDPLQVSHGVPQGARDFVFAAFCTYINDLPEAANNCELESYVDDMKTLLSFSLSEIDTAVNSLERDLRNVATWCCKNNASFNKCRQNKVYHDGKQAVVEQLDTIGNGS